MYHELRKRGTIPVASILQPGLQRREQSAVRESGIRFPDLRCAANLSSGFANQFE